MDLLNYEPLQPVINFFLWLWAQSQTKFLVAHIGINTVVAVAVTIYTKEFQLGKLWEFLYRKLLPYVGVYAALAAGGDAIGQPAFALLVWGIIETKLLTDLFENGKKMLIIFREDDGRSAITREVSWLK